MTKEEYKQWVLKTKNNRTRIFHKQCEKCIHEAHKCISSNLQDIQGPDICDNCACLEPRDGYFTCRCESKPTYIERYYTKKCRYFKEDKNG